MKGIVLVDYKKNDTGVILAENGSRYDFTLKHWAETEFPLRGMEVDFVADGDTAYAIYNISPLRSALSEEDRKSIETIIYGIDDKFNRLTRILWCITALFGFLILFHVITYVSFSSRNTASENQRIEPPKIRVPSQE